jgi:bifunctional non-homologous end joining protein LigD
VTWLDGLTDAEKAVLVPAELPRSLAPMLATRARDDRIDRPGWLYERKLDGQRIVAFCGGAEVRLRSRTDKSADAAYPEVVDALHAQVHSDCVLDGEVVAFDGATTSFPLLQNRMHQSNPDVSRRSPVKVYFYVFDIVHLDGIDLTRLPLRRRKALLRTAVDPDGPVRFTTHRNDGVALYDTACAQGWEGIIAKRGDATYQTRRSPDWLKFKCEMGQELVVGGWTEPKGSRSDLGALLVGYRSGTDFVLAGRVGTGFDDATLRSLGAELLALERPSAPFAPHPALPTRDVHWCDPQMVVEAAFTEWTPDGQMRHPRYLGLRRDKDPAAVVREA